MKTDYWNRNIWLMSGEELKATLPLPRWALFHCHYQDLGIGIGASPAAVEARMDPRDWESKQGITKAVHEAARYFEEQLRKEDEEQEG